MQKPLTKPKTGGQANEYMTVLPLPLRLAEDWFSEYQPIGCGETVDIGAYVSALEDLECQNSQNLN